MKNKEEIEAMTSKERGEYIAKLEARLNEIAGEKKKQGEERVSAILESVYKALRDGNVKIDDLYSNSINHYLEAISSYKALSIYCNSCQTHNAHILGLNDKDLLEFFHIGEIAVYEKNGELKETTININEAPESDVKRFAAKIRGNIIKEQSSLSVLSEELNKASENIFAPGVKGSLSQLAGEYLDHNKLFSLKEKAFGDYSIGKDRFFNQGDNMQEVSDAYNKLLQKYLDEENDPLNTQFEYQLAVTEDELRPLVEHTSEDIKFTPQQLAISSRDLPLQLTSNEQSTEVSKTVVERSKKASGRIMTQEAAEATKKSALASLNYNMNEMAQFMNQSAVVIRAMHNSLAQLNDLPIKTNQERFSDRIVMDSESLMAELDTILKNGYSIRELTQQLGTDRLFEVVARQSMNPDSLTVDKEKFITNYLKMAFGPEMMMKDKEGKHLYKKDDDLIQDVNKITGELEKALVTYNKKLANDRLLELDDCAKTLQDITRLRDQAKKANPEMKSADDITLENLNKLLDHIKDEHNRKVIDFQEAYIKNLQASIADPSQKKDLSLYQQYDFATKTELKNLFEYFNKSLNDILKNAKIKNEGELADVNKKIDIFNKCKDDIKTLQAAVEFFKDADIKIAELQSKPNTKKMNEVKSSFKFIHSNSSKSQDEQDKLAAIEVYKEDNKGRLPTGIKLNNYDSEKDAASQDLQTANKRFTQILETLDEGAYKTKLQDEKARLESKDNKLTKKQTELKEFKDKLEKEKYSFGVTKQVEVKQEASKGWGISVLASFITRAKKTPVEQGKELETSLSKTNQTLFDMLKITLEKVKRFLSKLSFQEIFGSKSNALENARPESHISSLSSSPSTRSRSSSLASCESKDEDLNAAKAPSHAANVGFQRSSSSTSGRRK